MWDIRNSAARQARWHEIWLTDLRGRHRRRLGALEISAREEEEEEFSVDWLPGGNALAVNRSGKLWIVPVHFH
jgi:hypothetical protein